MKNRAASHCGRKEKKMKHIRFLAIFLVLIAAFLLASCSEDTDYVKDPTASLKSDDEDYFVPNIYIDVEKEEGAHLGGDKYGEYIPIQSTTTTTTPKPDPDPDPEPDLVILTDPYDVVELLFSLERNKMVEGEFILAGEIFDVDEEGNPTIVVEGLEEYPVYCPDIPLGDPIGKLITISGRFLVNDDGIYKLEDCIFICDGILDPSDAE